MMSYYQTWWIDVYVKMQNSFLGFHSLTLFTLKFPISKEFFHSLKKIDILILIQLYTTSYFSMFTAMLRRMSSFVVLTMLLLLPGTSLHGDNDGDDETGACDHQVSCSDCILLPHCVYCTDANYTQDISRCMLRWDHWWSDLWPMSDVDPSIKSLDAWQQRTQLTE